MGGLLGISSRLLNKKLESMFVESDLSITQMQWVLLLELEIGEYKTPAALADRMMKSRGAITQLIKALERAGMVEKKPDIDDARSYSLAITKQGIETASKGKALAHSCLENVFDNFSKDELATFSSLLKKTVKNLS